MAKQSTAQAPKQSYRGLAEDADNYYVYLMFFESPTGEFYLKVGKSGSLATRFRDIRKASPLIPFSAYTIDVAEFDFVADGMEAIFKRRLSPFNTKGEWHYVTEQFFDFLNYVTQLIAVSQKNDPEVWEDNSESAFFSIMGFRTKSGFPMDFDWDEILRSNDPYPFIETTYDEKTHSVQFGAVTSVDEMAKLVLDQMRTKGFTPKFDVTVPPDWNFHDYFARHEIGNERAKWWVK